MQQEFEQHLEANFPFLTHEKCLIAVSGGVDSVVLTHLCKSVNLDIALAHCNFQLRGAESEADENFVRELGEQIKYPVFVKRFNTRQEVGSTEKSIQLRAREQRYAWFDKLSRQHKYPYILTGHHLNDEVETFLINLLRGTGLSGLSGIPEKNKNILRPLLPFSRRQIENYAQKHQLQWREDTTNATDDYRRNRIRHHIIPLLVEENPDFLSNFFKTQKHLKQAEYLLADYSRFLTKKLTQRKAHKTYIDIEQLKALPHTKGVLYQLLKDYGFTAWDDIYALLTAQPGKQVLSKRYRLLKDRDFLVIKEKAEKSEKEILIKSPNSVTKFPKGTLRCEMVPKILRYNDEITYLAANKLTFPLKLRIWQPGDVFQPLGMKGHKKVSDFLKDEKLSLFEKENTWVLCADDQIVWVVNHRIDDAYKVGKDSTNILKIELDV